MKSVSLRQEIRYLGSRLGPLLFGNSPFELKSMDSTFRHLPCFVLLFVGFEARGAKFSNGI